MSTPDVLHLPAGQGPTLWFGEAVYTFKAAAGSTGGALTLAEASVPPGNGPPPHVHAEVDEAFFVLAGELEFLSGERTFRAGAGDFVFVPRGVRHRFRNVGLHVARTLFLFVPGGMDGYFTEIGVPARAGETGPALTEEQRRQVVDIAPRYGLTIAP